MLGTIDWSAVGALAGIAAAAFVLVPATSKTVRDRLLRSRAATKRVDLLEIRLFGLPADPATGAKKMDGEFDRIDKRLDEMPEKIIVAMKQNGR